MYIHIYERKLRTRRGRERAAGEGINRLRRVRASVSRGFRVMFRAERERERERERRERGERKRAREDTSETDSGNSKESPPFHHPSQGISGRRDSGYSSGNRG